MRMNTVETLTSAIMWRCCQIFAAFHVQDYFDVVQQPMDLSTIREKLALGKYPDPWECINDIQLMFDNAWLYNRKTSKVYKYCSKVMNAVFIRSYCMDV